MSLAKISSVLCGAVLADKPEGVPSTKMVSLLRHELDIKKIGHTGILDRAASGLMILLVGRATGFAQFFLHADKEYIADFYFGKSTDTHDREGQSSAEISKEEASNFLERKEELIQKIIANWVHLKEQRPPIYSALKRNGKRLSDHVRAGLSVEVKMRPIEIYSSRVIDYIVPDACVRVALRVSGGTYVRSLARDLGEELEVPVHLGALRRTAVGLHKLQTNAWQPEKNKPLLLSIQETLPSWPRMGLDSAVHIQKVKQGIFLPIQTLKGEAPKRIYQNFFIEDQKEQALAWAVRTNRGYRYRRVLS